MAEAIPDSKLPDEPIAAKVNSRFTRAYNLLLSQRDASNEDIRFCDVDGGMWEDFFPEQFANRPRLEFNKVSESVYRTYAEWMNNRFRVKYLADDSRASDDDAKVLNGLYRRDEANCSGLDAYDVAFNEMIKGGVGGWRLRTQFVNEEDDREEQEVVFEPIFNAYNCIVWDENAKKYDKSDAKWCVVLHEFTKEAYEAKYPGAPVSSFGVTPFFDRTVFNWTTKSRVFVAEYFEVVEVKETVFVYKDPFGVEKTMWKSDIKDQMSELTEGGFEKVKEFKKNRRIVEKTVTSSEQVLEETVKIAGKHIPVVPVYGFRSYVDGQEFFYGKVRKLKDPNRLFNMAISRFAEDASTTGKRVPILYPDEIEGLENYWSQAHLAKYAYLVKKPHINVDNVEVERQIQYLEPPSVDPNNMAIAEVSGAFIDQAAGNNPADVMDSTASGVALREQSMRMEMPDSILFENMAKSMRRAGVIYRSIAADIYDGERFIMLLNEDGSSNPTVLNDFVIGDGGKVTYVNSITEGEYKVSVDTGPAFASRRRETVAMLQEIISTTPQGSEELPVLISALISNVDGEGLDDVQEWTRNRMIMQGIKKPETEEQKAMLAQAQGQEQKVDPLLQIAQLDSETKHLIAQSSLMKATNEQANTQIKAFDTQAGVANDQAKTEISMFEAQTKRGALQVDAQEAGANIEYKRMDTMDKAVSAQLKQAELAEKEMARRMQGMSNDELAILINPQPI